MLKRIFDIPSTVDDREERPLTTNQNNDDDGSERDKEFTYENKEIADKVEALIRFILSIDFMTYSNGNAFRFGNSLDAMENNYPKVNPVVNIPIGTDWIVALNPNRLDSEIGESIRFIIDNGPIIDSLMIALCTAYKFDEVIDKSRRALFAQDYIRSQSEECRVEFYKRAGKRGEVNFCDTIFPVECFRRITSKGLSDYVSKLKIQKNETQAANSRA